ncbi:single-stranded-DNA-specific exonuclease RecJ [Bacillus suaedaesalsae]|uniref:Single-stranded-DNA-specific exonuclease RecJ n=1 Tax=Bacillus suaedaesalsae TaxID=2810349 RepID=A0ABS2DML2_9BACI|nr:single-stranded-DNA-specific exonuclease RecJ [Bacillus suaedaesalsae]MBM6619709.1 single-stranded-DNA-specific exonuclease RecJ [Bacillus suaedaesalsae]
MFSSKTRWMQKEVNEQVTEQLMNGLSVPKLIANLLITRGINTVEDAQTFLNIESQPFHSPFLLDGMEETVARIKLAINNNEKILVFGDYDADGVSSTTVMIGALRMLGATADFYIPNRFSEGYGPNSGAFQWAYDEGYRLIITVDTGISALNEANFAKQLGIDLIITDHHEPGPTLPAAFSIIHPKKLGGEYPFHELAGVGVALKVAQALLEEVPQDFLAFAAIGTIADLVPLHDENRLIARKGIKALQQTKNPGILALLKACNVNQSEVSEETIGFSIGPRINAVGRLGDADPAVDLFLTKDPDEAASIADEMNAINKERQMIVNEITQEAIDMIEAEFPLTDHSVLIIAKEDWNAGVVGIVASRLVEKYYRPTIVLSIDREKNIAKGSARSIEGFDLFENLSTCRDILPHFGGHTMAAGMTLSLEHVDELRKRLNLLANEKLTDEDFIPVTHVDIECRIEDVTIDTIKQLNLLSPYGVGNPKPKVAIHDNAISQMKKIGSDQSHLKILLEDAGTTLDGIAFGFGHVTDHISPLAKISVLGELSINEWNNHLKPQIMVNDIWVREWQLFDLRGNKSNSKQVALLKDNDKIVTFHPESIQSLQLQSYTDKIFVYDEQSLEDLESTIESIFFADLPSTTQSIRTIIEKVKPKRVYCLFHPKETHFFATIPTREHFKWFYAFLTKNKELNLSIHGEKLAKSRGWSKETIDFMSKVFFELEFVTIKNGIITLSNQPTKRDLTESKTYSQKQDQIEIENELLYSSYSQLKNWFDHVYTGLVTV